MRDEDTHTIMLAFSFRLRDTRTASRLTQDRLARRPGVHITEISKLERALTDPASRPLCGSHAASTCRPPRWSRTATRTRS